MIIRFLALFNTVLLCRASSVQTRSLPFQSGAYVNQTIEELVSTDDSFLLFRDLLGAAAFDEPLENVTIFLPLSIPGPFYITVMRRLPEPQWELHFLDIVNTIIYEGAIHSLGLFLMSSLTMRNGEELKVSTSSVQNGTVEFTFENPSLRSLLPALGLGSLPPAQIVVKDISISNGVIIHLIDALVLPSWVVLNSLQVAVSDPTFSAAISISLELAFLAGNNLFTRDSFVTVLAPINGAWNEHGDEFLEFYQDPNNVDELGEAMHGHFLTEVYPFSRAQDGDVLTSFADSLVTVSVDKNSSVSFNGAKLMESMPYFLASNGLVYAVDKVIVPTSASPSTEATAMPTFFPAVPSSTALQSNVPSAANKQQIPNGGSPVETSTALSGAAIAGIILGGAAMLVLGMYLFRNAYYSGHNSQPVPMAAALPTTDHYDDPPTTLEPAIMEVLPPIVPHSERIAARPRASASKQDGPAYKDRVRNANNNNPSDSDRDKHQFGPEFKDQMRSAMGSSSTNVSTLMVGQEQSGPDEGEGDNESND